MDTTKRKHQMVSSAPLEALIADYDMSHVQVAEVLGVSNSAVSRYVKAGQMPKVLRLAVECLRRRKNVNRDEMVMVAMWVRRADLEYCIETINRLGFHPEVVDPQKAQR